MNRQEAAEITALQALGWLVSQPDEVGGFLNATGAATADLAQAARDPRFLAAVMDFLLETDARVLACAADLGLPPTALAEARMGLPGGQDPHWT
jgi:alkanesulfonate monooxygenase SsuD/methylene tetrahydromethanopterin reductase-like flavin-dependent oxidoreductase (luciferase family)